MKELVKYCESKEFDFKQVSEKIIEIAGKTYEMVLPDANGKLFSPDYILMASRTECDNYVFKFGGNYYWTPADEIKQPNLNPLRYLGTIQATPTPFFLGVRGAFELLNGSGNYKDWVKKAKFLGVKYLGICEKNTLAGVMKFQNECVAAGIQPIIGETVTVERNDSLRYDIKLYCDSQESFETLLEVNKYVNVVHKGYITEAELIENLDGLRAVLDPKSIKYEDTFPLDLHADLYYQIDTVIYEDDDRDKEYLLNLKKFVRGAKYPPMIINDAFYLEKEHNHIKRILNSISGVRDFISENQYMKTIDDFMFEFNNLFKPSDKSFYGLYQKAFSNTDLYCKHNDFKVETKARHLPKYKMTPQEQAKFKTNEDLFWYLIEDGLRRKAPKDQIAEYIDRIHIEFGVIEMGDVVDYFLILWDIIKRGAHENNIITGIARGSAGGCMIAYMQDIIQINPLEFDLLFERFLNEGRIKVSLPDIDVDFPASKRSIIKEYMEERYGHDQVCSVGTYTALQVRNAIKDISRVYGIPFDEVNRVTKYLEGKKMKDVFEAACGNQTVNKFVAMYPHVINDVFLVLGQPKAPSIHACAMMIFPEEKTMYHWTPVREQDGQIVSEWEGNELENAGFLKEDILGIKQLDKFENILELIKGNKGIDFNLSTIPLDDRKVYEFFKKGWNGDVFHFGSTGLTGYCRELQPDNIEDLIAGISLYRPGAMENNFHNEYILRKEGKREVEYFTGSEKVLDKTYGVFVYQEQIMKLCQVLGGLSLVQADDVRKAMVKKKYEALHQYKEMFIPNYQKLFGVTEEYAYKVWDTIDKASTYLFNRSHAAAYTITGYWSQYLKVHFPLEYWSTAFEFASEDDFASYINEINQIGDIKIIPVHINKSSIGVNTDFEHNAIIWPINSVKQVGSIAAQQIIDDRAKNGDYFDLEDFISRHDFKGSKVNKQVTENLILSGAFDELENVLDPTRRIKLIEAFRKQKNVKIDPEKDLFTLNVDELKKFWWWGLQQKRLCGISFFDYEDIVESSSFVFPNDDYNFFDEVEFNEEKFLKGKEKAVIAGYVHLVEVKESKKIGKYAKIQIESNYEFTNCMIWNDVFEQAPDLWGQIEKSIIIISGDAGYDSKTQRNQLFTNSDTEVLILG